MRRLSLTTAILAVAAALASPAVAKEPAPKLADHAGIHVVGVERLSPRLLDVTVATKALDNEEHVRVLLPKNYARESRRYPVLYLLHGGVDDYRSWTDKGDAEKITASSPLIVVMPEAGDGGWYADWDNYGAGGTPMWETFHIDQIVAWTDRNLRTVARREGRALAGLSMGGLGTMSYASRHPDLFVSAASFSGAVDTNHLGARVLIEDVSGPAVGPEKSVYGLRAMNEINWRGHNPWDLAANLRGMVLGIYGGNGRPHEGQSGFPLDPIEYATHEMSVSLHEKLWELDIPHKWVTGRGQHQWGDWQAYLRTWLPTMMSTFAHPPARPNAFAFTAAEDAYDIHGWNVRVLRAAPEFSTFRASANEFSITGSGDAIVTTPRRYRPGAVQRVWMAPENAKCAAVSTRADRSGRLTFKVPLGPANADQQFTAQSQARGRSVFTATTYLTRPGSLCM
ncbi:MAG TPA: alpha/beta hydrolase family protein [Actinomycetota bacterium]|jgi:S-formylglutathione hydrolase FrmB|nr:alpha/beta hydrolase family protein [Actinomycetota bacterium]